MRQDAHAPSKPTCARRARVETQRGEAKRARGLDFRHATHRPPQPSARAPPRLARALAGRAGERTHVDAPFPTRTIPRPDTSLGHRVPVRIRLDFSLFVLQIMDPPPAVKAAQEGDAAYFERLSDSEILDLLKARDEDGRGLLHTLAAAPSSAPLRAVIETHKGLDLSDLVDRADEEARAGPDARRRWSRSGGGVRGKGGEGASVSVRRISYAAAFAIVGVSYSR